MWRKYVAAIVVILLNHGTKYQSKYALDGYDVKVLTADDVEKFADDEKQNGIM